MSCLKVSLVLEGRVIDVFEYDFEVCAGLFFDLDVVFFDYGKLS